jgi:hypothetical protein
LARKITTIIWHLIKNSEMYEDKTGYEKGEVQIRKIVGTETFSIDERITIISGIIAIIGNKEQEYVGTESSHTFMPKRKRKREWDRKRKKSRTEKGIQKQGQMNEDFKKRLRVSGDGDSEFESKISKKGLKLSSRGIQSYLIVEIEQPFPAGNSARRLCRLR